MVSRFQIKDLIGLELSAVCYVRDYVELHFDGPILRCLADPIIAGSSGRFEHPEAARETHSARSLGRSSWRPPTRRRGYVSSLLGMKLFSSRNGHPALDQRSRPCPLIRWHP